MEYELQHHGILGMKWGRRRYQNKDGSLTAAGQKRYNAEMAKVKAETKKLENKQKTSAKLSKLDAAKKNLEALKKGKKPSDETDEQRKERLLKNPNPKEVYENRHLFSNKEIGDLYIRLNNEANIQRLLPKDVEDGKSRSDKAFDKLGNMTEKAVTASKAWNAAASIINAFNGTDGVSLPKIDVDNINKGNKKTRAEEKKAAKKAKKEAEKEAEEAHKSEKAEDSGKTKASTPSPAEGRKAVDAFISKVPDKPVSKASPSLSRKQIENMLDSGEYDFNTYGRYDRNWDRWDDD